MTWVEHQLSLGAGTGIHLSIISHPQPRESRKHLAYDIKHITLKQLTLSQGPSAYCMSIGLSVFVCV